jgi:hypothetical protein
VKHRARGEKPEGGEWAEVEVALAAALSAIGLQGRQGGRGVHTCVVCFVWGAALGQRCAGEFMQHNDLLLPNHTVFSGGGGGVIVVV